MRTRKLKENAVYLKPHPTNDDGDINYDDTATTDDSNCKHKPCDDDTTDDTTDDTVSDDETDDSSGDDCKHKPCDDDTNVYYYYNNSTLAPSSIATLSPPTGSLTADDFIYIGAGKFSIRERTISNKSIFNLAFLQNRCSCSGMRNCCWGGPWI